MQLDLYDWQPALQKVEPEQAFDGITYSPERDYGRLHGQLREVFVLMSDGKWRSLREIGEKIHGSEAALSARLRDLRKERYGGFIIERMCISKGLWRYRLVKPAA